MSLPSSRAAVAAAALLVITAMPGLAQAATCVSGTLRYTCEEASLRTITYEPLYDNGLNGTVDLANATPLHLEWPDELDGIDIPEGAVYQPAYRAAAEVYASLNGTAQPSASNVAYVRELTPDNLGGLASENNLTAVMQYKVNFSANIIMSGSSEFYYASPIAWVPENFSAHYVQIHDADGRYVTGARYPPRTFEFFDGPVNASVGSTLHNGTVYYRLSAPLESEANYTITEYVKTVGSPPLGMPNVRVFLAPGQDVDSNGYRTTRFFPGTPVERVIEEDVAFSFRFVHGLHPGGSWKTLQAPSDQTMYLFAKGLTIDNLNLAGTHLSILVPIISSVPYDATINIWGDGWSVNSGTLEDITGSINLQLPIDGTIDYSDAAQTVEVDWWINLKEVPGVCVEANFSQCAALNYPIYQEYDANDLPIGHFANSTAGDYYASDYAAFIELSTTNASGGDISTRGNSALQAAAIIIAGGVLIGAAIVTAPVSVPLAVGLAVVGTALIVGSTVVMDDATRETILRLLQEGKDILTLAACGGAVVAPGLALKLTFASACALLGLAPYLGGLPSLLRIVLDLAELVIEGVEKISQWIAEHMDVIGPITLAILFAVAGLLLVYTALAAVKYLLLAFLCIFTPWVPHKNAEGKTEWGYKRPKQWPLFRKIYNWYFIVFSDLVERRLFKMDVHA